ncbi:MAG: cob(I)yrinic acid a,c-diamide adenosyltransferase [Chloroflexi bacterium]|nr:cob(I)yrinic acid a,c-diamide adenosyltransferase [Chloroflexota bacterium]
MTNKSSLPSDRARVDPCASGLVQLYTGSGKGKTTAATGCVVRAAGHGLRVHIVYFMKGDTRYGEQSVLAGLPNVSFERFGSLDFVDPQNVKEEEKRQARDALEAARRAIFSGQYDIVVLDEVNVAVGWKLLDLQEVVNLVETKPGNVDLILTGRYADPKLIELADLVTEMVEIKHHYRKGIQARAGVEY